MKKRLETLRRKIATARENFSAAVAQEQQVCQHTNIAECDYEHRNYSRSFPPIRICLDCGMTEEGWGPGYVVLKTGAPQKIDRDELYRQRAGLEITDAHKGPLLRKEATVAGFVTGAFVLEDD